MRAFLLKGKLALAEDYPSQPAQPDQTNMKLSKHTSQSARSRDV